MKRTLLVAMCVALLAGIAMPAMAQQTGLNTSGTVSLDYWMADISSEGETADQNFLPALTAVITSSSNWGVIAEYEDSDSDTSSAGTTFETKRYLFGVRYDFAYGWYADLAYVNTDVDLGFGAGVTGGVKVDGIRIGGGIDYPFEGSPWSMTADLGFGISPDATVSLAGASAGGDGEEVDFSLKFSYRFNKEGLLGNIGYKYVKLGADNNAGTTLDAKVDGFFLGAGYEWK